MIHEAPLPLEIAPMGTAQDLTLLHPIGVQVHMDSSMARQHYHCSN